MEIRNRSKLIWQLLIELIRNSDIESIDGKKG